MCMLVIFKWFVELKYIKRLNLNKFIIENVKEILQKLLHSSSFISPNLISTNIYCRPLLMLTFIIFNSFKLPDATMSYDCNQKYIQEDFSDL